MKEGNTDKKIMRNFIGKTLDHACIRNLEDMWVYNIFIAMWCGEHFQIDSCTCSPIVIGKGKAGWAGN